MRECRASCISGQSLRGSRITVEGIRLSSGGWWIDRAREVDRVAVHGEGRTIALAGAIPCGPAIEEREGHPVYFPAFQPDEFDRHFQAHPLARGWQRPHVTATIGAINPPANIVCAPIAAMFPRSIVPLQHHFGRHLRWI